MVCSAHKRGFKPWLFHFQSNLPLTHLVTRKLGSPPLCGRASRSPCFYPVQPQPLGSFGKCDSTTMAEVWGASRRPTLLTSVLSLGQPGGRGQDSAGVYIHSWKSRG